MFRSIIIVSFIFSLALNANINKKIEQLMGPINYATNESLINYLFNDKDSFYDFSGNLNYKKVIEVLEKNELINIKLKSKQTVNYEFLLSNNPKKSLNLLKDILKSQGHLNFLTTQIKLLESGELLWRFKIDQSAAINPLLLSQNLTKHFCKIEDIKKEGNSWTYKINTFTSDIYNPFDFVSNEEMILKKPLKEYILKIANAKALKIYSYNGNKWRPNITFYDENLEVLKFYKKENFTRRLFVSIPLNTRYIKINDLYSLENLKKGIKVTKE